MQLEDADLPASGPVRTSSPDQNQKVVYATVRHTHSHQADPETVVTSHMLPPPGGTEEEGDRGGAVGRALPGGKPKAELKLSRSLSKSDSDLLTCSPTEDDAMGSRSESLSNCSTGKKRLEKSPSFASEWDEVRLTLTQTLARNKSVLYELPLMKSVQEVGVAGSREGACVLRRGASKLGDTKYSHGLHEFTPLCASLLEKR